MKKVFKLIAVLFALCITFSVNAFTKGEKFTWGAKGTADIDGTAFLTARAAGGSKAYHASIYHVQEKEPPIYCLDPQASTPDYLFVNRILLDSKAYEAQDTGIFYTLKYDGTHSNDADFQRGIAIRMLYDGIYGLTNQNASPENLADLKGAADWAVSYCDGNGNSTFHGGAVNMQYTYSNGKTYGLYVGARHSSGVVSYFCSGYDAYRKVKSGNYDNALAYVGITQKTSTYEGDNETSFVAEIAFEHFVEASGASAKIGGFEKTGGTLTINGASFTYDDDPKSSAYDMSLYNSLTSDMYNNPEVQEQLRKGNKGNAKVYVAFTLEHGDLAQDANDVCNYEIKLKVEFQHPKAMSGAILQADMGGRDSSKFQRFVIFDPAGDITQSFNPCTSTCKTSDNLIPNVCEDGLVPDEEGNVVYSFREAYFEDKSLYDIKRCILNNTDEALNNYKYVNTESANILYNNPYCSLYCKEDVAFNLPYKRTVANGRYFDIALDVAGKQECYSSEINSCQLNDDLQGLQQNLIFAYNEYIFYDWLLESSHLKFDSVPECIWHEEAPDVLEHWHTECDTCEDCSTDEEGNESCTSYSCNCVDIFDYYYCSSWPEVDDAAREYASDNKKAYGKVDFTDAGFQGFITYTEDPTDCSADITNIGRSDAIPDYIKSKTKLYTETSKVVFGGRATNSGYTLSHTSNSIEKGDSDYVVSKLSVPDPIPPAVPTPISPGKAECTSQSWSCSSGSAVASGRDYYEFTNYDTDYNNQVAYMEAERESAMERIKQIREDLRARVILFDSCVGTGNIKIRVEEDSSDKAYSQKWLTPFKFEPEFTYSYDEPNVEEYTPEQKWIELVKAIGKDKMLGFDYVVEEEDSGSIGGKQIPNLNYEEYNDTFFDSSTQTSRTFCIGTINEKYECVDKNNKEQPGKLISTSGVAAKENLDIVKLVEVDVKSTPYKWVDAKLEYYETKVNYVRTTASAEAHFETERVFYTSNPTGKVIVNDGPPEDNGEVKQNWELVDGLPVSIQTPMGVYYYKIFFDQIGTYYSTQQLGRIYGIAGSSVSNIRSMISVKEADKNVQVEPYAYACTYDVGPYEPDIPGTGGNYCVEASEAYYVCSGIEYDEDSCEKKDSRADALSEVGCSPDEPCSNNYNCCPNCTITCVGECIFKSEDIGSYSGESLLNFRPVNLSSFNPNERDLGYNWYKGNTTNVLVAQKAGITISEIGSRVEIENIDTASSNKLKALNATALEVTLTPKMIEDIRTYNKTALSSGSYNNQTLECFDYVLSYGKEACKSGGFTWVPDDTSDPKSSGKCTMANIMCYSSFIDKLQDDYEDQIISERPRLSERGDVSEPSGSITNFTNYVSADFNTNVSKNAGYALQVKNVNNYWGVFRYASLDVNADGIPDIGPSWK